MENCTYMRRYLFSLLAALVCSASVHAVVASPDPVEVKQGDGTTITVKMVGDEFHHYYTTLDGTPLRKNEQGMFVADPSVVKQSEHARNLRRAAQAVQKTASYPLEGSPKSLVILVNFKDMKFTYKLDRFQRLLNESGYKDDGGIGSARDYFIACSDSVFSPQFDCYGPVTVSQNYAYYGGKNGNSNDSHAGQMIVEACNLVADNGVDLTQYDTDNDGRLDNVFVYYAGHNEAEHGGENTIWPHRSVIRTGDRVQGKLIYDYACTSELRGSSGSSMCGIGTFCHEFGHVLGLPDYYDTGYGQYTVGTWDIMCSGSYNGNGKTPPSYTAGERFQLGWLQPIQLTHAGSQTLEPLETSNKAYLLADGTHNLSWESASPSEYWLLENRQNVGWDANANCLPATGMLIWHIDYSASAWGANEPNNSTPLRYHLEEAGGVKGYSAQSDPYPGSRKVTTFTPVLHNGKILEQPITSIAQVGQNIIFNYLSNDFMFIPTELPTIQSTYIEETQTSYTPASAVKIVGKHLDPEQEVQLSITGTGFAFSTDSANWVRKMTATVKADSTLELPLYIRFSPNKQICEADMKSGTLTVQQDITSASYIVRGVSPRPTLIEPPYISEFYEVSPTSFKFKWDQDEDAELYFLTLYHMEDGQESIVESFEGFDDESTVWESGWYTSFYRTTAKAKTDGAVSMWFKEKDEYMISPVYPQPVTALSMWISAPATTESEVGWIVLSGYNEAGIKTIDTIKVTKSTKNYVYSRSFSKEGYLRFRLDYYSFGGEGVCLDAFTTTFDQKTIYTYRGREYSIPGPETEFYAYNLLPNTLYYVQMQSYENKGCEEHISALSQVLYVQTKEGEAADSKHLTLAYDSINYDPARHVIYLPQSLTSGSLNIYSPEGELVKSIPVQGSNNIIPLDEGDFRRGTMYMIKYLPADKMSRKSPWIKIIFQ